MVGDRWNLLQWVDVQGGIRLRRALEGDVRHLLPAGAGILVPGPREGHRLDPAGPVPEHRAPDPHPGGQGRTPIRRPPGQGGLEIVPRTDPDPHRGAVPGRVPAGTSCVRLFDLTPEDPPIGGHQPGPAGGSESEVPSLEVFLAAGGMSPRFPIPDLQVPRLRHRLSGGQSQSRIEDRVGAAVGAADGSESGSPVGREAAVDGADPGTGVPGG